MGISRTEPVLLENSRFGARLYTVRLKLTPEPPAEPVNG